jgi:hypothetical protein
MAFDILDNNRESDQSADPACATGQRPPQEAQILACDGAAEALHQAGAIITMVTYHLYGEAQRLRDDILQLAFPLARLLASAAQDAPNAYRTEIVDRVTQAASMGKVLAATVQEAVGQPVENFRWLEQFIWALETQVDELLELMSRPGAGN